MTQHEYKAMVEAQLGKYLSSSALDPKLLECMAYSVSAGGKRLRPCMLLAACDMLRGECEAALPLACAIEMIHTYSLIHDDLPCMDNDDYRRGRPTNHKVFGEGIAVLAGDGLLSYAFEIMLEAGLRYQSGNPHYFEAIYAIAQGAGVCGMIAGQFSDLKNENNPNMNAELLKYIHSHKTGSMLKAALIAGAKVANASEQELFAISSFGEEYGLLFQITDDILDAEGDPALLGKSVGKDAAEGKLTYVSLYGLEKAKELAKQTSAKAREALSPLSECADYFHALIDDTFGRSC